MYVKILILISIIVLILISYWIWKKFSEPFSNFNVSTKPDELIIFVSEKCPHCVSYNKYHHDNVVDWANKSGIRVNRIYSNNDPEHMFEKYDIQYVPNGIFIKDGKVLKNLGSRLDLDTIKNTI